ncbi:MAG: peptide deformylase [Elusimicrobiota bacterium]
MAVRPIRFFPDPVLKAPCQGVARVTPATAALIQDLNDTLDASPGVGLAAPQIGKSLRVAVIDVSRGSGKRPRPGSNHGRIVLLNPEILSVEGIQIPREGCLSVPDMLADVRRYASVRVRALDAEERELVLEAEGFEALAVQHEIDHLDGRLFLDRVANLKTDLFRRKHPKT